jgi:uncharacterized protein YaaQ
MKLLITIVQDADAGKLQKVLNERGFASTKLASSGGFLREGNTTLMIGVDNHAVAQVKEIIREICRERSKLVPTNVAISEVQEAFATQPMEVRVGGAVVFVLDVNDFWRM